MTRVKVLIADDSAIVREVVAGQLEASPEMEVVGRACNGQEAVELARRLEPDVILMDVRMPVMDGIEATEAIMSDVGVPILILSGTLGEDPGIAFRAIQAGAVDVIAKPTGTLSADYAHPTLDLVRRVKLVAGVPTVRRPSRPQGSTSALTMKEPPPRHRIVAIGASTGGPPAFSTVLGDLGPDCPAPIVCVQHITAGFLDGFIEWLNSVLDVTVGVAEEGELLEAGRVYFAPEGKHLVVRRGYRATLSDAPPRDGHRPAVTTLFESVAEAAGSRGVGVLLTGMGADGAAGLLAMHERGARTIAQDRETSVIHGMPAAAIVLGAVDETVAIERVGERIIEAMDGREGP